MIIKTSALTIQDALHRSTGLINSRGCMIRLKSYFPQQDLWRFQVFGGKKDSRQGGWEVNIWLEKDEKKSPAQLNFKAKCGCPAWVYWGSEYHAVGRDFLYDRKRGPATPPRVRDPLGKNLVCKHVYLALNEMVKGHNFFNVAK